MPTAFDYDTFVTRNEGYLTRATQDQVAKTRLLFAGCGLGSGTAICAARTGFQHFVLIDGDTVDAHNLNRQFFTQADIGEYKAVALKRRILEINPEAQVEAIVANVDAQNADELVAKVDIVFDTIDFLDLPAILALHQAARHHKRPVITALSIGFGVGTLFFEAEAGETLPEIIQRDVEKSTAEGDASYANVFAKIMARIGAHLDRQVVEQVARALTIMEDGRPCPASQLAIGAFATAAQAVTLMLRYLEGAEVPRAPTMVVHSFKNLETKYVDIAPPA
jgi:predicted ThiF/HesA family dinucleotide-utilizing enzyme